MKASGNFLDAVAKPTMITIDQWLARRAEYSHIYPAPDAKPEFCESVMRSIPEPSDKPTIEQLATDYRNAKDYAERKQQEADAAKADVGAKLKALELAGEALGLMVSPITAKQEHELVITDWRDLRVGDRIWCCEDEELAAGEHVVLVMEEPDYDGVRAVAVEGSSPARHWIDTSKEWRFISRP